MADDPIRLMPTPPPRGPLAWWSTLEMQAKAFLSVGTLIALVIASTRGCDIVSAEDLTVLEQKQDAVDTEQNTKLDALDAEREQQFILNAILEQRTSAIEKRLEWSNEALWRVVSDLGLNEGRGAVRPPPVPTPKPVQTSAQPIPTGAPTP